MPSFPILKLSKAQWWTIAATLVMLAVFILILRSMGRIPMCECGFGVWTMSAWSSSTSQHIGDPYSFSHILHGILFLGALYLIARRMPLRYKFLIATLVEIGWEILENSPIIINRYRAATASLDYFGDSILNSVGDVLFMMLGFWFAAKFSWKVTFVFVVIVELVMLAMIKDNLTLNILMLLYPIDAIREWQLVR